MLFNKIHFKFNLQSSKFQACQLFPKNIISLFQIDPLKYFNFIFKKSKTGSISQFAKIQMNLYEIETNLN